MTKRAPFWVTIGAGLLALAPSPTASLSTEVVAVLSSDLRPYREALAGFEAALGHPVPTHLATEPTNGIASGKRLVVAFGGKAALALYTERAPLVYCLAPAVDLDASRRRAPCTRVELLPRPEVVVSQLLELQPGLRRLAALWVSEGSAFYVRQLHEAARNRGVEVTLEQLGSAEELPGLLRRLARNRPGALWVPPDPLLLTPESFSVLKSFAWGQRIPLYVSSEGLVERGAVAAVTTSYEGIGRSAAAATRAFLEGRPLEPGLYPDEVELSVNVSAATHTGIRPSSEILRKAKRVFP